MEFGGDDLLRVEGVIVTEFFQNSAHLGRTAAHQSVDLFQVGAALFDQQVVDVGGQDLMNFRAARRCERSSVPKRVDRPGIIGK